MNPGERIAFYISCVDLWYHKTRWAQLLCYTLLVVALIALVMFCFYQAAIDLTDGNY